MLSLMMGLWLASDFIGNLLVGYLGTFWSSMTPAPFFLMLAGIAAAAGGIITLLNVSLSGALRE
jgi:proton-dependent oligopeptide transporter, POT family